MKSPEDEFNEIIDAIEIRCMASDGPVIPTLKEATEQELSRLWELVNEISPKRKALKRKMLRIETATTDEVEEYLRSEGLDPDQIANEGVVFVKTVKKNIEMYSALLRAKEAIESAQFAEYNNEYESQRQGKPRLTERLEKYRQALSEINKILEE